MYSWVGLYAILLFHHIFRRLATSLRKLKRLFYIIILMDNDCTDIIKHTKQFILHEFFKLLGIMKVVMSLKWLNQTLLT